MRSSRRVFRYADGINRFYSHAWVIGLEDYFRSCGRGSNSSTNRRLCLSENSLEANDDLRWLTGNLPEHPHDSSIIGLDKRRTRFQCKATHERGSHSASFLFTIFKSSSGRKLSPARRMLTCNNLAYLPLAGTLTAGTLCSRTNPLKAGRSVVMIVRYKFSCASICRANSS